MQRGGLKICRSVGERGRPKTGCGRLAPPHRKKSCGSAIAHGSVAQDEGCSVENRGG